MLNQNIKSVSNKALICSSFIPCYSGFIPPKFKGVVSLAYQMNNLQIGSKL